MTKAPATPITETFIVFLNPSHSSTRLSQMKDHSKAARIFMAPYENTSGRAEAQPLDRRTCSLARAGRLWDGAPRILEVDFRTGRIQAEQWVEATRNGALQDRPEHVAGLHPTNGRVDPGLDL